MTEKQCGCGRIHSLYHLPNILKNNDSGMTQFNCQCGSTCLVYTEILKAVLLNNVQPTVEHCRQQVIAQMMSEIEKVA